MNYATAVLVSSYYFVIIAFDLNAYKHLRAVAPEKQKGLPQKPFIMIRHPLYIVHHTSYITHRTFSSRLFLRHLTIILLQFLLYFEWYRGVLMKMHFEFSPALRD
jgi:protein-S-isoprenylcysteine O-methyltransferase Ste14